MKAMRRCRVFAGMLALFVVFAVFSGCARLTGNTVSSEKVEAEGVEAAETPEPVYYDFEDVLVPAELKVDQRKSFVYHAPGFKAGILSLSGRVELSSLVTFFENNMEKDNWQLVSSFKSPRTIMFFNKPNRSCIMNITEKQFTTEVEVWVAPSVEAEGASLLK